MKTTEHGNIDEHNYVRENSSYNEANRVDEFLNFKVNHLSEISTFNTSAKAVDSSKQKKNKNHKKLLTTALATVSSAAIVAVAVVASILGVTLKSKDVGYYHISYDLTVNANGEDLYGILTNYGEVIQEVELTDGDISVRFDDLYLDMEYVFVVQDKSGKTYFSDEVRTLSPITVYTKETDPDFLFFSVDLSAFGMDANLVPYLSANDFYYEFPISQNWAEETALLLEDFVAGEYTLFIADNSGDYPVDIFSTTIYIDGTLAA